MKTPRLNLRTLMIVVAVVALEGWGFSLLRWSEMLGAEATRHEFELWKAKRNLFAESHEYDLYLDGWRRKQRLTPAEAASIATWKRVIDYEDFMIQKYRRAARVPWYRIDPDPTRPSPR
jgi:hypothetical protein